MKFFVIIFHLPIATLSWHGYNESYVKDSRFCHHTYAESTRPVHKEQYQQMKLWPGLNSRTAGESIYGFKHGIEQIWRHQFPHNCSERKFLISGGWPYGFGSRIHMEGVGLAIAMQLGRIYLPHPAGDNIFWETNNPFCRDVRKDHTLMCYYEPWSSCSYNDALRDVEGNVDKAITITATDLNGIFDSDHTALMQALEAYSSHRAVNIIFTTGKGVFDGHRAIPQLFHRTLDCSPMRVDNRYYWWRAVSAAFLLRPNTETLEILSQHRTLNLSSTSSKCVSMFVRHADKGMEMQLLPFEVYANTTLELVNKGYVSYSDKSKVEISQNHNLQEPAAENKESVSFGQELQNTMPTVFLSTDDPDVIIQAETWGRYHNWNIVYTNLFDRATQTARLDWDAQHKKGTKAVHDDLEYISMLLNLEYSVQCDAWVCTLASNSCR